MPSLSTRMLCAGLSLSLFFGACKTKDDAGPSISPKGDPPAWGPGMHDEMLAVVEQWDALNVPPLENMTPAQARTQQTIFNAYEMVAHAHGLSGPMATADTFGRNIPVPGGEIHARFYQPATGPQPFPAIIYFHGGAFVMGSIDTYDGTTRALAEQSRMMVVSVGYRLGSENKFPTAHNDAYAAYKWIIENAASLHIDPTRLALVGEDAGANLACNVSIAATKDKIKVPDYQLLIQPITEAALNTASYTTYAQAQPLNKAIMDWGFRNYLRHDSERVDPRISLGYANLSHLPPTGIINAQIDPLLDDGQQLESYMRAAGNAVERRIYDGVTHDFYPMSAVVPEARDAQAWANQVLKAALQ